MKFPVATSAQAFPQWGARMKAAEKPGGKATPSRVITATGVD
jgi:hypothetical protein